MSVSTCRNCALRNENENIEGMLRKAIAHLNGTGDLGEAYNLLNDALSILRVVIIVETEL